MANRRSIAGFGFNEVANIDENININNDVNASIIGPTTKTDDLAKPSAPVRTLLDLHEKQWDLQLVGVYLEPRYNEILCDLSKQGKRGVKSRIVNEALKHLFEKYGML